MKPEFSCRIYDVRCHLERIICRKEFSMKRIQDSQRNISIEIEKLSKRPFYSMRYYGDDCFDEYLFRGAHSLEDYCSFIDTALIRNRENQICHNNFGCGSIALHGSGCFGASGSH